MRRPVWMLLVSAVAAGAAVGLPGAYPVPAFAQSPHPGVDLTAPAVTPPAPEIGLRPAMPPEQRGSRDQEFYPGQVRARHEPAFVVPFTSTIRTSRTSGVRVGLSAWTAPAVPFDIPQASGGPAFGLTIVWGVPLAENKAQESEPPAQR